MRKEISLVLTLILLSNPNLFCQDENVSRKLEDQFRKGAVGKCQKKALKYKSKYPKSDIPKFYLSKIDIYNYSACKPRETAKQWKYLRSASKYANTLSKTYTHWQDSVQYICKSHILSQYDSTKKSTKVKSYLKYYTQTYTDTLDIYYVFYPRLTAKINPREDKDPIPVVDSLRSAMLSFAKQWVGVPYKYAGEKPETGFDCSGFTKYIYEHIGVELPHNAHLQSKMQGEIISIEDAEPGDLIFFGHRSEKSYRTQHAGIFYSNENGEPKVIHCVSGGVSIDGDNSSWDHYWKDLILFVKRLPDLQP